MTDGVMNDDLTAATEDSTVVGTEGEGFDG